MSLHQEREAFTNFTRQRNYQLTVTIANQESLTDLRQRYAFAKLDGTVRNIPYDLSDFW